MSTIKENGSRFWLYTSNTGVVYDIEESSADFCIIIDSGKEFMDSEICPHIHLVDYMFGQPDEVEGKDFLDTRIDFYEKHERTLRFGGPGCSCQNYETYLGTEEPKQWCSAKMISVEEMKKMAHKEIPLPIAYVNLIEATLNTVLDHNLTSLIYEDDAESQTETKAKIQEVLHQFCTPLTQAQKDTEIHC